MRIGALIVLFLTSCSDGNMSSDAAAGACVHNSDCPSDRPFCLPPCNCLVDDAGHRCDVFVASCVQTLQGFPCVLQGDQVVCCR